MRDRESDSEREREPKEVLTFVRKSEQATQKMRMNDLTAAIVYCVAFVASAVTGSYGYSDGTRTTTKTRSYPNSINFIVSRLTLAATAMSRMNISLYTQCLNNHDRENTINHQNDRNERARGREMHVAFFLICVALNGQDNEINPGCTLILSESSSMKYT